MTLKPFARIPTLLYPTLPNSLPRASFGAGLADQLLEHRIQKLIWSCPKKVSNNHEKLPALLEGMFDDATQSCIKILVLKTKCLQKSIV